MTKILQNVAVYIAVCILFVLAVTTSILAGGSLPAFGTGVLPHADSITVSQSPFPPPPPDTPPVRRQLAQSPFPPPPPDTPPTRSI